MSFFGDPEILKKNRKYLESLSAEDLHEILPTIIEFSAIGTVPSISTPCKTVNSRQYIRHLCKVYSFAEASRWHELADDAIDQLRTHEDARGSRSLEPFHVIPDVYNRTKKKSKLRKYVACRCAALVLTKSEDLEDKERIDSISMHSRSISGFRQDLEKMIDRLKSLGVEVGDDPIEVGTRVFQPCFFHKHTRKERCASAHSENAVSNELVSEDNRNVDCEVGDVEELEAVSKAVNNLDSEMLEEEVHSIGDITEDVSHVENPDGEVGIEKVSEYPRQPLPSKLLKAEQEDPEESGKPLTAASKESYSATSLQTTVKGEEYQFILDTVGDPMLRENNSSSIEEQTAPVQQQSSSFQQHSKAKPMQCPGCKATFPSRSKFHQHFKAEKSSRVPGNCSERSYSKPRLCMECGESFSIRSDLHEHRQKHVRLTPGT